MTVAVLVPCYNEGATIRRVVAEFKRALPYAAVYVYDNNSSDNTRTEAIAAGAIVRTETEQGKGNVVRRMFSDIDADVYVLVDGDATYDASHAPVLIQELLDQQAAMVVGRRVHVAADAYRAGHVLGNTLFTKSISRLFGGTMTDILSGYRVFSRAFVKSFPATSRGFEIETELTVHSLTLFLPVCEVETPYLARPEGSASKLNTWSDGLHIILKILELVRIERPILFYFSVSLFLLAISFVAGWPLVTTYLQTGLVPRLPTGVLVMGLMIMATISAVCGLVLDSVTHGQRDLKRLAFVAANTSSLRMSAGR